MSLVAFITYESMTLTSGSFPLFNLVCSIILMILKIRQKVYVHIFHTPCKLSFVVEYTALKFFDLSSVHVSICKILIFPNIWKSPGPIMIKFQSYMYDRLKMNLEKPSS